MRLSGTISQRMYLGFACLTVLAIVLAGTALYGARQGATALKLIGREKLVAVDQLRVAESRIRSFRGVQAMLAMPGVSAEERRAVRERITTLREEYGAAIDVYGGMPRNEQQDALWREFQAALQFSHAKTNAFTSVIEEFEAVDVPDPMLAARQLERFIGDHYKASRRILEALDSGQAFEGGDDHTACAFGTWLPEFETTNPDLSAAMERVQQPHAEFHRAVRNFNDALADGGRDAARVVYHEEVTPTIDAVFAELEALRAAATRGVDLLSTAQHQLANEVAPALTAVVDSLDQLAHSVEVEALAAVEANVATAGWIEKTTIVVGIAAVALSVVIAVLIARGVNRALGVTIDGLQRGAQEVNSAARQVSESSQSLAQITSSSAARLEEATATLEEMTNTTERNANDADEANRLAGDARHSADQGQETMVELNTAMGAINDSANQIGKIIKVIEEIAFQTNLLALNAAVEAARAGEHGKGFAVVADEVRNLALRAADAARETTGLIEDSVTRAKHGAEVAGAASSGLNAIAGGVTTIAQLLGGISQASHEQARQVGSLRDAVEDLDRSSQSNAAAAEESAGAAEELTAFSVALKDQLVGDLVALVQGDRQSEPREEA